MEYQAREIKALYSSAIRS